MNDTLSSAVHQEARTPVPLAGADRREPSDPSPDCAASPSSFILHNSSFPSDGKLAAESAVGAIDVVRGIHVPLASGRVPEPHETPGRVAGLPVIPAPSEGNYEGGSMKYETGAPAHPGPLHNSSLILHTSESQCLAASEHDELCRRFDQLQTQGLSLRLAAMELGKSPSWFSGPDSPYRRWKERGLGGLLQSNVQSPKSKVGGLTEEIEALGWFIPAAHHFNSHINRNTDGGSVPEAIRCTVSLPALPEGWKRSDERRLLRVLHLPALPVCPPELRTRILERERAGQPLVLSASPARSSSPRSPMPGNAVPTRPVSLTPPHPVPA